MGMAPAVAVFGCNRPMVDLRERDKVPFGGKTMAVSFTGDTAPGPNVQVGITTTGTLTIDGGTAFVASTLDAGVNVDATGTVTVTGAGSSATFNNASVPQVTIGDA